jgi:hypothetical protein
MCRARWIAISIFCVGLFLPAAAAYAQSSWWKIPPDRDQIDANAQSFQALDCQTVVVLGTDKKLWLEHAPFGNVPPDREQIDANAQSFQALDRQTVVVLGTDKKLWLEHASVPRPCTIGASPPFLNEAARELVGVGDRGPSCTSATEMIVTLMHYHSFCFIICFDGKIEQNRGTGTNFEVSVRHHCAGAGSQTVYTKVEAQGKTVESSPVPINFCQ